MQCDFILILIGLFISKRVLIILELDVLKNGNEVGHRIGHPVDLDDANKQKDTTPKSSSNAMQKTPIKRKSNTSENPMVPPSKQPYIANRNIKIIDLRPILSDYQNWTIKARVTAKHSIRHWSNERGKGKLFNMDLMDTSGQIRVTCFKDLVDKFYDMIEVIMLIN